MPKLDAFGMEIEAVGWCAIKNVAFDGATKTVGMSAMDAELMCATCLRIKLDTVLSFIYIMCQRRLAIFVIDYLSGRIERIARKREGDFSAFCSWSCGGRYGSI